MTDLASKLQSKIKTYKQQTRRPRRLPPSTWPSSGRPSRSWRRSRSAPSLLPSSKPRWTTDLCQLKLEKNLTKSGTLQKHPYTVKIQKLPRRRLQTPDIKLCFPKPLDVSLGRLFPLNKGSLQPPSFIIS